ncbi:hypothetical protein RA27_20640 [Ruegeria sp. ANG-R]|uniref:hypothetical protein n=1 Tax=Ruegeria sp. ANG-R TaxID=1577903 RepID=UPI00057EE537|nr:hypothetical protein [Ruegeria sp. ANG-R]KIC38171.1 hypothetical protein RA27_20640 [Ruegeria sp. ANG-R]
MSQVPNYNFQIRVGNTGTLKSRDGLVLRFLAKDQPFDLTGSEIHFFASGGGGLWLHWQEGEHLTIKPDEGIIALPFREPSLFRNVPRGQLVRYEIERRFDGHQRCLLEGAITLVRGIDND